MVRSFDTDREWQRYGTELFSRSVAHLTEADAVGDSELSGWSRKHLLAHVAANAEALGRLIHWARTGERTEMYSSTEQRNADIAAGSALPVAELKQWCQNSADQLDAAMAQLTSKQWQREVRTAQGRTVPATETAWMRAREVMVHTVDLGTGRGFDELPPDFLAALCTDIIGKRATTVGTQAPAIVVEASDTGAEWQLGGEGEPIRVVGSQSEIAAYLAGRRHQVSTTDLRGVPVLGAWL